MYFQKACHNVVTYILAFQFFLILNAKGTFLNYKITENIETDLL